MRFTLLSVLLALAGCAPGAGAPADRATMPLNAEGGPELSQAQAIGLAGWALNDPANTAGKPELAARAIAAEEWLSGQTTLYGSFGSYAPSGQPFWAELRREARAAIGVAADAPSQQVVDRLLAASDALAAGQTATAREKLDAPVFSLGPDATLQALAHLPALPGKQTAFAELNRYAFPSGGGAR